MQQLSRIQLQTRVASHLWKWQSTYM